MHQINLIYYEKFMYEQQVDTNQQIRIEQYFNKSYDIHLILRAAGFVEEHNAIRFEYLSGTLYSRYYRSNGEALYIQLNYQNGLIEIKTSDGSVLDHAFDVFAHYCHAGDVSKALNWESDSRINMAKLQTQPQPQTLPLPLQNQEWQYQAAPPPFPLPPPTQSYTNHPYPTMDIDFMLDNSTPK